MFVFPLVSASVAFAAASAIPGRIESPQSVLDTMIRDNIELRAGDSGDGGTSNIFVLALVKLESNDATGFARSRQIAMQRIGEYLGAQVSSAVKSEQSEGSDSSGKELSASFFSNSSKVEVDRSLAGIEGFKAVIVGTELRMAFMLSEGGVRQCDTLLEAARARDPSGAVVVETMGIASIVGVVEDARTKAIDSAQRCAVEMALGATLVGMTFSDTSEVDEKFTQAFRDISCTSTNGFIEEFEVSAEGTDPPGTYFVRIKAKIVAHKIFDNYVAHLEALGSPVFVIDAGGDQPLADRMTQFFSEKGFRIAEGVADPDWRIVAQPTYTERVHPTDGKSGVQCQLALKLLNARTGDVASGISTDGKASDFLSGGVDAQKRRAIETAFKKSAPELHKAINDSIVRMAKEGRPVRIRLAGFDPTNKGVDAAIPSALQQRLAQLPGLKNPKIGVTNSWVTIEVKSLVPSDLLAQLVAAEACVLLPNSRERLTKVALDEIEIYLDPVAETASGG